MRAAPCADQASCLQWADFAVQHKGTSYKLHVYVAWAKELNSEINHGSQTDLMDGTGLSAGLSTCLMGSRGQFCMSGCEHATAECELRLWQPVCGPMRNSMKVSAGTEGH